MALASAGKVPARGRKFVVFGLFFMVFSLDCNGPRVKIRDQMALARETRSKSQGPRPAVQGMYYHFTQCGQFWANLGQFAHSQGIVFGLLAGL